MFDYVIVKSSNPTIFQDEINAYLNNKKNPDYKYELKGTITIKGNEYNQVLLGEKINKKKANIV